MFASPEMLNSVPLGTSEHDAMIDDVSDVGESSVSVIVPSVTSNSSRLGPSTWPSRSPAATTSSTKPLRRTRRRGITARTPPTMRSATATSVITIPE